jgi:hypothetical protein
MVHFTKQDKEDIQFDGYMRLIEGIVLSILDNVSISGKWLKKDIALVSLEKKRRVLEEMKLWFKDDKWDIWLNIYCEYHGYNERHIKKNFEKIRRNSVRYVNRRIKNKLV